jgi:hypothetical protein
LICHYLFLGLHGTDNLLRGTLALDVHGQRNAEHDDRGGR